MVDGISVSRSLGGGFSVLTGDRLEVFYERVEVLVCMSKFVVMTGKLHCDVCAQFRVPGR